MVIIFFHVTHLVVRALLGASIKVMTRSEFISSLAWHIWCISMGCAFLWVHNMLAHKYDLIFIMS